jgi:hypothetical protein
VDREPPASQVFAAVMSFGQSLPDFPNTISGVVIRYRPVVDLTGFLT